MAYITVKSATVPPTPTRAPIIAFFSQCGVYGGGRNLAFLQMTGPFVAFLRQILQISGLYPLMGHVLHFNFVFPTSSTIDSQLILKKLSPPTKLFFTTLFSLSFSQSQI